MQVRIFFIVGNNQRSKRKSVSASAVPPRKPATRSRSQAVKVLDHVFSPLAKKGESVEESTAGTSDESKRTKRFSVRTKRTSYKF